MIFIMDVGNTNIKMALFEGDEMKQYWRVSTNRMYTSDEYGMILNGLFDHAGLKLSCVEGVIMSSVVRAVCPGMASPSTCCRPASSSTTGSAPWLFCCLFFVFLLSKST